MESPEKMNQPKMKTRKWSFFVLGILVGLIVAFSVFLINQSFFNENSSVVRIIEKIYRTDQVVPDSTEKELVQQRVSTVQKDTVSSAIQDTLFADDVELEDEFIGLDDVEFTIEFPDIEDIVILDKVIASRQVKVINKTPAEENSSTPIPLASLEIQQWSTPIRNSITYQKNDNILRIKGIDISKVELYYYHGDYYLINGPVSYSIPNNTYYERLQEKQIPNSKNP